MIGVIKLLLFLLIFIAVDALWILLEIIFYGEVRPEMVDTIIGVLFSLSVCFNIRYMIKKSEQEEVSYKNWIEFRRTSDTVAWTAQKTEFGITVGRYINGRFEDISFDTKQEYLEWKQRTGANVTECFTN